MDSSLAQKYQVTQKVVLAQQQYIKDLEAKVQHATKTASSTQIQQLQRGINHFRNMATTTDAENRRLQHELTRTKADLSTTQANTSFSSSSSLPQNSSMTRKVQQEYARKLEAAKQDLLELERVVARNQKLATSAHQVLEEERNHRERLVEEQVSNRVRSIVANTEQSAKVEVSALRTELSRLKANLVERNDGAKDLRDELMNDVGRLRKQLNRQNRAHDDHVSKLHDQLVQTVRVMEEREIIIAEERQAYESELALSKEVGEEKTHGLMQQINDLNGHSEALTRTLAKQPLLYTDDEGNLEPVEERSVRQVEEEYEERMRGVLKMKEKSEARLLAERQQLLESLEEEDAIRTERERLKEADLTARMHQKDSMLNLWEKREKVLLEEVDGLTLQIEQIIELGTHRENTLMLQVQALSHGGADKKDQPLDVESKKEAQLLNEELKRVQQDFTAYRNTFHQNAVHNIADQTIELQNALAVAQEQLKASKGVDLGDGSGDGSDGEPTTVVVLVEEYRALRDELNVLRKNALERDTSLSMVVEKHLKVQDDLRTALRDSVDAFELEQMKAETAQKKYHDTVTELREYVKLADDAHTKSEDISSKELQRLRKETDELHTSNKQQRKQYEAVIVRQEKSMREHMDAHRKEAQGLRSTIVDVQKAFTAHRHATERERLRLVSVVELLEQNKTDMIEGQLEDEERVSEMMKELQTTLEERRQAFDVLEEEANAMRTRLDVYANYGMDEEGNANHGGKGGKGGKGKVSLPALWKKRQAAVRRAEELGLSEVELLRERLNDTEKRLNTIRSPLMDELQLLRKAQDSQEEVVLEAQQLWEDERRRFVEQIEVMDERVTFSESSVEEQINVLVGEIQAIEKIREQVQVGESEWTNRSAKEQQMLQHRRTAVEKEYEIYMEKHAKDMHTMHANVIDLAQQFQELNTVTESMNSAAESNMKKEMLKQKQKAETLLDTLNVERVMLLQSKKTAEQTKTLNSEEMTSYRNKFHHMRRVATEQQASLTAEKRALLQQIEQLSSRAGQTNHAKAIANHFGTQLGVAEEARHVEREASKKEIVSLRLALSKERERSEKRARQHAKELANQMNMSKERIHAEENLIAMGLKTENDLLLTNEKIDSKTSQ